MRQNQDFGKARRVHFLCEKTRLARFADELACSTITDADRTRGEDESLAFEALTPAEFQFTAQVEETYRRLIGSALADRENGLGGKLFYAGELDEEGRALVAAANIAGAGTLVVAGDRDAQKQAIRDGIADFLVNSLDEALRILKNELRKRETVAVCVGIVPEAIEREMTDRGVQPDLLRADLSTRRTPEGLTVNVSERADADLKETPALVTWSVASTPARWLPVLDAIALDCLDANAWQARRWLRLAPRFLGRLAHGLRLISVDRDFAARFIERVRAQVQSGGIAFGVEIRTHTGGVEYAQRLSPGDE
jgi:Urocanase Rossmann-like domain